MVKKLVMECTRRKFLGGIGAAALVSAWQTNPSFGQNSPQSGLADWSRFGYDLHNTRFNVRETTLGPGNVGRLKPKWIFDAGGRIQTCPTVIGDTLFLVPEDKSQVPENVIMAYQKFLKVLKYVFMGILLLGIYTLVVTSL